MEQFFQSLNWPGAAAFSIFIMSAAYAAGMLFKALADGWDTQIIHVHDDVPAKVKMFRTKEGTNKKDAPNE
jgi:hypothetical protein